VEELSNSEDTYVFVTTKVRRRWKRDCCSWTTAYSF